MPQFDYKAKISTSGSISTGVIEAPDVQSAMEKLRAQKLIVIEIKETKKKGLLGFLSKLKGGKVKLSELTIFSRQLSTLINSGVPIVQGLNILEEQIPSKGFKKVIHSLKENIESGISIADAMKKHPEAFSDLYVAMIRAGEIGGILDVILDRLSSYLESSEALKGKIKGAMMYPAVVLFIATGATIFLLTSVIPQFSKIFAEMGAKLPLPTLIMLALSGFLRKYIIFVILVPVGIFIGYKQLYKRNLKFQYNIDKIKMSLPVFGNMIRKTSVAKFTKTLSALIKSGVPILQALETVAQTSGNKVVEKAIMDARESIKEGEKISGPLKKSGIFPPMVIQMISVGEETGSLDAMLSKISEFYEREVDDAVKGLTSMIEPLIIVFMGAVIGGIVLSMFLPMFSLTDMMSQQG